MAIPKISEDWEVDIVSQCDPTPCLAPNPGFQTGPRILSFCASYGAKNLYRPLIPLEADPKECHYSPWYQIADNSANSSLNNIVNSHMLLDRNISNEPSGCPQNYIYYTTKFKQKLVLYMQKRLIFCVVVSCVHIIVQEKEFLNVNKNERNGDCLILIKIYSLYMSRSSVRNI